MFKTITISILSAIIALSSAWDAIAAPKQLKFAIFTPVKEPTYKAMFLPFAEGATRDSKGTIKIDTFPGGSLGRNPRAQLKLALDGVVDISFIIPSYTPGRFPDNDVFELPGLFANVKEGSNTSWRLFQKGMLRGFENVVVLTMTQTHPYFLHSKNKVSKLADFKGLKIRVAGPVFGATVKALGATGVGMPIISVAENISRGIVDAVTIEFNGHYAFRTKDVAKFTLLSNSSSGLFGTAMLATVMNKKIFEGLPAAGRKSILKHRGQEAINNFARAHDAGHRKLLAISDKNPDLTVTRLSAGEQKKFDAKMAKVITAWAAKSDRRKKLIAAVRAEVKVIRAGK